MNGNNLIEEYYFGSILYNRGLYPEESFARVKKYGLPLLLSQDEGVKSFISNLTSQLSGNFSNSSHVHFHRVRFSQIGLKKLIK